jgi:predicted adenylyl cyclase CyaB
MVACTPFNFMKELEIKILEVQRDRIKTILANLGAKKVFEGEIETVFFDFRDGAIIKAKNVLRLRKEKDKTGLTLKTVHGNQEVKTADEYTVEVSSLETMKKILEFLGLSVIEEMRKHRVSYDLEQAHVDIDQYLGNFAYIPEFLEIEAENIELIHKYAEALGYKAKDCLPWSTSDLINFYSSKKGKT